jgi:dienelactone hydrolase
MIGYCPGGTIAWLSATRLNPDAVVGYYAGRIGNYYGKLLKFRSCCLSASATPTSQKQR